MYNFSFRSDNKGFEVLYRTSGDVTGDRIRDFVYIIGKRETSSVYVTSITLVIKDGQTGKLTFIPLEESIGINPRLFLGDFNGDGVKDIFISIDTGGSGAIMYHYIYSFVNNLPRLIFDFNVYNSEYNYEITYRDNYKVEALSKKNNKKYIIDISLKGREYLDEIYDANGKLKEPISGFVNPLSGLYPVDFDSNGVYELLAYQKIAGRYNADSLGYFLNTLSWENGKFHLFNQNVAIWGGESS